MSAVGIPRNLQRFCRNEGPHVHRYCAVFYFQDDIGISDGYTFPNILSCDVMSNQLIGKQGLYIDLCFMRRAIH